MSRIPLPRLSADAAIYDASVSADSAIDHKATITSQLNLKTFRLPVDSATHIINKNLFFLIYILLSGLMPNVFS